MFLGIEFGAGEVIPAATLLAEAVLVFALFKIFFRNPVFFGFAPDFGAASPPNAPVPEVASGAPHVCPLLIPGPNPELLPEPKVGVSDLPKPGNICFCALIPLPAMVLIAFSFLRAKLPALVAESPPALKPLIMLVLVNAVDVVALVLLDWLDVALDFIVVVLESGLERTNLFGPGLRRSFMSYIDFRLLNDM